MFHVFNRAVARLTIFEKPEDFDTFLRVIDETWEIVPLPIYAMVQMPDHWHFVVRPTTDNQVSEFLRRLSVGRTMRYHAHHGTGGARHLYQGRFKSFAIQNDEYLPKSGAIHESTLRFCDRDEWHCRLQHNNLRR